MPSCAGIDDREPAVRQRDPTWIIRPHAGIVGTTMHQRRGHRGGHILQRKPRTGADQDACYSTHLKTALRPMSLMEVYTLATALLRRHCPGRPARRL